MVVLQEYKNCAHDVNKTMMYCKNETAHR